MIEEIDLPYIGCFKSARQLGELDWAVCQQKCLELNSIIVTKKVTTENTPLFIKQFKSLNYKLKVGMGSRVPGGFRFGALRVQIPIVCMSFHN